MKRIETIAAEFPNVGVLLAGDTTALRGQLASIGFVCRDPGAAGVNWVVAESEAAAAAYPGLPVLKIGSKVSIFGLKQAISALFQSKVA